MNTQQIIESGKMIEPFKPSPVDTGVLKLDANENLFLDIEFVKNILVQAAKETDPRLYPQGEEEELSQLIADLNQVNPSQVVVSAGGDQIIELLYSLLERGSSVAAVTPTFSMYPRTATQRELVFREAALEPDFSLNVEKTLEVAEGSSILVVCNPNNPTGNQFPYDDILKLVGGFNGIVLVDEAYQEYAEYSLADQTERYKNLIILRTFSKAYGAAGLRLGYLITNQKLAITLREKYMTPFPISNIVLNTGCRLIKKQEQVQKVVGDTKLERIWLTERLNNIKGVKAYPSDANFVLFNIEKPYRVVYETLKNNGVLVRTIGRVLDKENYLRVTVAPRPILKRFIGALEEALR
jgi:histidinol-phosphate aminotransferase